MIIPEWTIVNVLLYSWLAVLALGVGPAEYTGMAMMAYSKFRAASGINSRAGMFLLYFLPLVALVVSALPYISHPTALQVLVFGAVALHFSKRVLESLFLHKYSGGMGLFTTTLIAAFYSFSAYLIGYLNRAPLTSMDLWSYLGMALYIVGIFGNFFHHKLLVDLRKDSLEYKIPTGGLFEWVACPHYLFEILIWLGIFLLSRHLGAFFIFIFVVGYLTARSLRTLKWYQEKFPNFPVGRKALLPYIL